MRSTLRSLGLFFALGLVPGCFGNGPLYAPPRTIGDQGRTTWVIYDGLCGDGTFGSECDLGTRLSTGAAPLVQIRSRGGAVLEGATLEAAAGVDITNVHTSSNDDGLILEANIGTASAGDVEVRVLAPGGEEIDRAHLIFVAPAAIRCGRLSTATNRDRAFAGLVAESTIEVVAVAGETTTSTTLACRVDDASGNALLTVRAVQWSIAAGAVGTISMVSDDLIGLPPAAGGTARLRTMGSGSGTVHATVGTVSSDIAITFR